MDFEVFACFTPGGEAAVSAALHPVEVLALLMDFSGSVALAELLHERPPRAAAHPHAAELARKLQAKLRTQLAAFVPLALEPLLNESGCAIPTASQLQEAIAKAAGTGRLPRGTAVKRLASELGAPFHAGLAASLAQTQARFAGLRAKIARELRELGPGADRLERIDAALQRSIQDKLASVFERSLPAAELSFERACARACAALPKTFGADDLVAWAADGGFIADHHAHCVRMARGLVEHLRRNLEGLVAAALAAESI
jgi:hypothetical protein